MNKCSQCGQDWPTEYGFVLTASAPNATPEYLKANGTFTSKLSEAKFILAGSGFVEWPKILPNEVWSYSFSRVERTKFAVRLRT